MEDSFTIAKRLIDPHEKCDICGIPATKLWQWWNEGGPFLSPGKQNRRLTVDHIIPKGPSDLKNIRLLCWSCNDMRGANRFRDEEIRRRMQRWYFKVIPSQEELEWFYVSSR